MMNKLVFKFFVVLFIGLPMASCRRAERFIHDVTSHEGGTFIPDFDGLVIDIPPNNLTADGELSVSQLLETEQIYKTNNVGPVYKVELIDSELIGALEISIQIPVSYAIGIAPAYVIHWTGSEWEYLPSVESDGWVKAEVSSLSEFSVGHRAEILLEREDGTLESGWLEIHGSGETQLVVLFNSKGEKIDESNVSSYKGGVHYHQGGILYFDLALDILEPHEIGGTYVISGIPAGEFFKAVLKYAEVVMGKIYQDMVRLGDVYKYQPGSWESTCIVKDGYDAISRLGISYRTEGAVTAMGQKPWLYVSVSQAENINGESVYFLVYQGTEVEMVAEVEAVELIPGTEQLFQFPSHIDLPISDMKVVALAVGRPNIPWWQFWEDRDDRILCVFGDIQLTQDEVVDEREDDWEGSVDVYEVPGLELDKLLSLSDIGEDYCYYANSIFITENEYFVDYRLKENGKTCVSFTIEALNSSENSLMQIESIPRYPEVFDYEENNIGDAGLLTVMGDFWSGIKLQVAVDRYYFELFTSDQAGEVGLAKEEIIKLGELITNRILSYQSSPGDSSIPEEDTQQIRQMVLPQCFDQVIFSKEGDYVPYVMSVEMGPLCNDIIAFYDLIEIPAKLTPALMPFSESYRLTLAHGVSYYEHAFECAPEFQDSYALAIGVHGIEMSSIRRACSLRLVWNGAEGFIYDESKNFKNQISGEFIEIHHFELHDDTVFREFANIPDLGIHLVEEIDGSLSGYAAFQSGNYISIIDVRSVPSSIDLSSLLDSASEAIKIFEPESGYETSNLQVQHQCPTFARDIEISKLGSVSEVQDYLNFLIDQLNPNFEGKVGIADSLVSDFDCDGRDDVLVFFYFETPYAWELSSGYLVQFDFYTYDVIREISLGNMYAGELDFQDLTGDGVPELLIDGVLGMGVNTIWQEFHVFSIPDFNDISPRPIEGMDEDGYNEFVIGEPEIIDANSNGLPDIIYRRIFLNNIVMGIPKCEQFLVMPYFFEWDSQSLSFKSLKPAMNILLDYALESIDSVCQDVGPEWQDIAFDVLYDQYGNEIIQNALEIYPGGGCDRN